MNQKQDIGVYFIVDEKKPDYLKFIKHLEEFAMSMPGVVVTWNSIAHPHCADCISSTIEKYEISNLIIFGEKPGEYKPYFSGIMADKGHAGDSVKLASLMEFGIDYTALDKAKLFLGTGMSYACL